jgi:hypothetical protein
MRKIITLAAGITAGVLTALAIPASASAVSATPRPWTSLCGAATGALCAQASRRDRYAIAEPYSTTSFRQADNWSYAGPNLVCGPGGWAPGVVYAAPYWCPFKTHALDTAMAGLPWGVQFVGMTRCAGASKVTGRWVAALMTCWRPATYLVRVPGSGEPASFISVTASDAAGQPMWLTLPHKAGQPLTWNSAAPGSLPGWVYTCPAKSCYP